MKGDGIKRCKWCGKEIAVITYGIYRKCVVDAEAVDVYADIDGEEYVRIDGSKVRGFEAGLDCVFQTEPAYRLHRMSCGG